jgi:hypothetical protein
LGRAGQVPAGTFFAASTLPLAGCKRYIDSDEDIAYKFVGVNSDVLRSSYFAFVYCGLLKRLMSNLLVVVIFIFVIGSGYEMRGWTMA